MADKGITVSFNPSEIRNEIERRTETAQKILDSEVLKDSNYFIPIDSHNLEASGIEQTVLGSGEIVWRMPYARVQYYGVNFDHSKSQNPNATAKWFESAKARHKKKWVEIVKNEYN